MKSNYYKLGSRTKQVLLALTLLMFSSKAQVTYTFNYTGGSQTLSLLAGTYSIEAWGGDGYTQTSGYNGKGGYATGILTLPSATTVHIYVGGIGTYPANGVTANAWTFNGGGIGYPAANTAYGNGGGASDVRTVGGLWDNTTSLASRVIVAGGGGAGRNTSYIGGNAGGLIGANGTYFSPDQSSGPTGGTQTAGGSNTGYTSGLTLATLGKAATWDGNTLTANFFAGGGGGYYGGASGRVAGGGGSSYIGGVTSGTTIMVGQPAFPANPDITGNGKVLIKELCNITVFANGNATLNPAICSGQSVTLTTNAISNYSWSSGQTTSSIVVAPGTNTVYSLVATSSLNCTASAAKTFSVNSTPPVLSISNPSSAICLGQTATLTASGALSYTWANAGVVNGQTFTPASTAVYTVTGSNGCGSSTASTTITVAPLAVSASVSSSIVCQGYTATLTAVSAVNGYTWLPGALSGSAAVVSPTSATIYTVIASDGVCAGTQTISLATKTTPTITASASATLVCPGDQVVLTATGGTSYVWTPGNLSGSSVTVSAITSTLYVVAGTNSANCTSSGNQVVVVIAPPNVTVTSNKIASCSGAQVVLTAAGANTYAWNGGPSTAVYSVSPSATTVYTVIGTQNNNPCPDTETISVTVVVPNVTATSNTSTCIGGTVQLSASGANTYAWNGIPGANIIVTPAATSVYTLVAQTNSASIVCPSTHTVQVSVNPNPTITVTSIRNVICKGETNTLTATGAASVVWQGTLGITNTVVVKPTVTTIYTLTGTSAAGCKSDAQITTVVSSCNGIAETTQANAISVFPNPSIGRFTVHTPSAMTLHLINTLGQVIRTLELNADNAYSVEVSGLAKGVYYLNTGDGAEQMHYTKLIVN